MSSTCSSRICSGVGAGRGVKVTSIPMLIPPRGYWEEIALQTAHSSAGQCQRRQQPAQGQQEKGPPQAHILQPFHLYPHPQTVSM